jgi:hypothetical protein
VKIYVAAVSEGAQDKGKTGWNFSLPPKLMEKLVSVPSKLMGL